MVHNAFQAFRAGVLMTQTEIMLDTRGLPAPEPLEHCLEALAELAPTQALLMWLDREPFPLYEILRRSGFKYHGTHQENGFQLIIRRN
ncbi:DUF2249 domain-containing protein [Alcaligenes faecalis]|nr:DUF2249 domain-containing protein [Alcaligenes faecalis]AYZ91037.1 DUF2249 domain-containing protein [Alcaligenes faecalis]QQC33149.1 DUF2249 domain-containing protein [Alcaligenes faecalis]USP48229.1 DUF2249 domain-containing protein [Alcaligenes faecalis]CAJ0890160.1 DUF2249 domain-containing protein [Alcaligenes faecalis subsp. faecalis]